MNFYLILMFFVFMKFYLILMFFVSIIENSTVMTLISNSLYIFSAAFNLLVATKIYIKASFELYFI